MELWYDSFKENKWKKCNNCGSSYAYLTRYILDREKPYAICFAELHKHSEPEVYLTCIIGKFDKKLSKNNITMSCRYGNVSNQSDYGFTLVDVLDQFKNPLFGRKLKRSEALKNNKINEFWNIVDYVVETDILIHDFFNHRTKYNLKKLLKMY